MLPCRPCRRRPTRPPNRCSNCTSQGAATSPNDGYADVHEKALFLIACGTRPCWVIEPVARLVTVYRRDGSQHTLRADDERTGDDVLPGFSVRVRELFPV